METANAREKFRKLGLPPPDRQARLSLRYTDNTSVKLWLFQGSEGYGLVLDPVLQGAFLVCKPFSASSVESYHPPTHTHTHPLNATYVVAETAKTKRDETCIYKGERSMNCGFSR